MSDIEKEFYETFNIPQKFYTIVNFGDLDNNYQEVSANSLEELFNNYNSYLDEYIEDIKDFMDWRSGYEDITSDIVLGLSKILMDFGWLHCEKFTIDKYLTEFDNDELKDKIQVVECNFEDCILKTCIQLKSEISEEVKALFKC